MNNTNWGLIGDAMVAFTVRKRTITDGTHALCNSLLTYPFVGAGSGPLVLDVMVYP